MKIKRSIPRSGCSIPCKINNPSSEILSEINCYVIDVSAEGLSVLPCDGTFPDWLNEAEHLGISLNMEEFSEIEHEIKFKVEKRWKRGTLLGLKISEIDVSNFKKWWFLIYTLFFPKKDEKK